MLIRNEIIPGPILQNHSAYFLLHKKLADLHQLKVFHSLAVIKLV